SEAELYRLLLKRLPDAAIVSIGHRSSLVQFHGRFFALKPEAPGRHRLAESKASDIEEDERDLTAASAEPSPINLLLSSCSRSSRRGRQACPSRWRGPLGRTCRNPVSPW